MRFFTTSILLGGLLLVIAPGCQTASLQCQRETALLRAEILDLEDKYYALQSQQASMLNGGHGNVISNGVIGSGVVLGTQVAGTPVISDGYPVIQGDVIYYDETLPYSAPIQQAPLGGEIYYEGQPIPGQVFPDQQIIQPGVEVLPTPAAQPDSFNLELGPTPAESNPTPAEGTFSESEQTDQTLSLPDSPELKVGYEDLDLDLADSEVDRIEIATSATRGKDLDGIAGDDVIELLVKTLDRDGAFVDKTGEMTITVTDQLVGEIGKWTFLPEELKLFLSRDEFGNTGTLLHLPWTDRIPVSKRVIIRVSMMIDNIEYVATRQIEIKPPTAAISNDEVVGWTSNDRRWVSGARGSRSQRSRSSSVSGRNSAPTRLPTSPSTAVKRPQWKPVR